MTPILPSRGGAPETGTGAPIVRCKRRVVHARSWLFRPRNKVSGRYKRLANSDHQNQKDSVPPKAERFLGLPLLPCKRGWLQVRSIPSPPQRKNIIVNQRKIGFAAIRVDADELLAAVRRSGLVKARIGQLIGLGGCCFGQGQWPPTGRVDDFNADSLF